MDGLATECSVIDFLAGSRYSCGKDGTTRFLRLFSQMDLRMFYCRGHLLAALAAAPFRLRVKIECYRYKTGHVRTAWRTPERREVPHTSSCELEEYP